MNGQPQVTVYWRPGCGFCRILRRELDRAGVERTEINIWQDLAAAAVVRSHARGNETVPTVLIGELAMVNPTAAEVVAARNRMAGTPTPAVPSLQSRGPLGPRASESPWPAMVWTVAACAVWAGLALANPTTTYHLAPAVALLSWPVIDRGRRPRDGWRPGLIAAAGATAMVAATTLVLLGRDALAGPALIGPDAAVETISLAALAAGVAIALARPRPPSSAQLVAHRRSGDREGVVAGSGDGRTSELSGG